MANRYLTTAALAGLTLTLATAAAPQAKGPAMKGVTKSDFGQTADGTKIDLYTLKNANGMVVKIMTYGGIITEIHVPDKNGKMADVVLGFDDLKGYLGAHPYFGAITGRVANRIAKGKFTLDGKEYKLATNNGPNALHGGEKGFDKRVWTASSGQPRVSLGTGTPSLGMRYRSPDGEEGYPGNLDVTVAYFLSDANELEIVYQAKSDKATPINLTNHSYFNLAGQGSGDILGHVMMINADQYTPVDNTLIPTGQIAAVKGTPLDFTTPTAIGARIKQVGGDPVGYDHNFVLRQPRGEMGRPALAARVTEPKTGRVMEVLTTEPGVQFYTGNFLDGTVKGKGGAVYKQYNGFCLETQHFPDSINHPNFPNTVLKPGDTYRSMTVYRFSTAK